MSEATEMVRAGTVWAFGDRVSVETISPLKYMFDTADRGRDCLAGLDPRFGREVAAGDIVVAGELFGHGPGHDHANIALVETGIGGLVATSFAPQFFRHSIDHGLLVAECPEILEIAAAGQRLRVDFAGGRIENLTTGARAEARVPEGPAREIVAKGGLIPFIREEMQK
jgi:3-isopropylmalate/(R)-2-methylmalate dehydratase small subunit